MENRLKKHYLLTGFLTVLPLVLTFYLFRVMVSFVGGFAAPILEPSFNTIFGAKHPVFYLEFGSFVLTVLLILAVGIVVVNLHVGRYLVAFFERMLLKIPFVSGPYMTVRKLTDFVSPTSPNKFQKVVLVPFPRSGSWTLGFVTADDTPEVSFRVGEPIFNVFVPTTPNPTSGFLIFAPRKDVIPLSMSVDQAMKMIVSGGISAPEFHSVEGAVQP